MRTVLWFACAAAVMVSSLHAQDFELRSRLSGHTGCIYSVVFSPDGKTLASASSDSTIILWDVASGKNTATLHNDDADVGVCCVAFNPSGKILASGGYNKAIMVWDVATGKNIRNFGGHDDRVSFLAFRSDGKILAVVGATLHTIRLRDGATEKTVDTLDGPIEAMALSPDGKTLASAGCDYTARLWNVANGKNTATFKGHTRRAVVTVVFSPDGKTLGERPSSA